ncbi:ABC transporter substrate-binding protein [Microbacterium sp. BWT-B31]|uniref:ABC transporter substrate-binding protein n=1 Tax=Microbacterium sp. BWT-B31 TaxID=3232072 RepID=UPI0035280842
MWNQNEPQAAIIADAIDAFTKDTGIEVDVQWQGRENITKLVPTLRVGAAADLVDGSVNALGPITSNAQQLDLTDTYAQTVPGEDAPLSKVISSAYVDAVSDESGIPTMVPYEVLSEAIWFDSAKYPELTETPQDWDSLIDVLSQIDGTGTPAIAIPSNDAYWVTLLLERSVGVAGLRALASDETGKAWEAPGVREALEAFDELRAFFPDGYAANQGADAQNLWASGGAATYLSGTWVPSEAAPNVANGFTFDSLQIPALKRGGSTAVGANFIGFTIPASAENSDAAAEFIAYFSQKEYAERIATEAVQISPRDDVEVPEQLRSVAEALTQSDLYADQGGLARDFPDWYTTIFRTMVTNFVTGQSDADSFIAESKRQTVEYLAVNG